MKGNFLQEKYLLFRAKNRDPEAFAKVYDLYAERIYRFVYFKVNKEDEAQDLTSEVFLKVWQYLIDGKEVKNLNALFYTVARNLVIDYYRSQVANKEISLDKENIEKIDDTQIDKIEIKIESDKVRQKLQYLKDEYREVIVLRFIEGLSIKEIAAIFEKKPGNVRVILYRAVAALKELMEDQTK